MPPPHCGRRARDRWIGWDDAGRRGHLQRVVCLSRFLIRPSVRCPHLASHVLGRILRRLPGDFEERYGFRPYLVESFADEGVDGTCLRAANFLCVGRTAGRGRQDREETPGADREDGLRVRVGTRLAQQAGGCAGGSRALAGTGRGPERAGLGAQRVWRSTLGRQTTFGTTGKSAGLLAAYPGHKINAAPDADNTAVNAFYRLIERARGVGDHARKHPRAAPRAQPPAHARPAHGSWRSRTGTDLNFSRRPGCDGLQLIGRNQTTANEPGLAHARDTGGDRNGPAARRARAGLRSGEDPFETGGETPQTQRWFEAFNGTADAAREIGRRTRVLSVCDREADMFELFDVQRRRPRVELLGARQV